MKKNNHTESFKRFQHIDHAIESIEKYVINESEQSFSTNRLMQDAVLFQFSIIGEAIQHIEDEILAKYNYPWFKIRSFRNLIAHEYFNIKMSAVWQILKKDLPELKELILKIISDEFITN